MRIFFVALLLFYSHLVSAQDSTRIRPDKVVKEESDQAGIWTKITTSKIVLIGSGFLLGLGLGLILSKFKNPLSKLSAIDLEDGDNSSTKINTTQIGERDFQDLETQIDTLRRQLSKKADEINELTRIRDEDRHLLNLGEGKCDFDGHHLQEKVRITQEQKTATQFFLQPSTDGKFKESSRVQDRVSAIYELTIDKRHSDEAKFSFIASNSITSFAIQNEPTWILVACERKNLPSEATKMVRTDIPGTAILTTNREWEIKTKAKITYL